MRRRLAKTISRGMFRYFLGTGAKGSRPLRTELLEDRRLLSVTPLSAAEVGALRDTTAAVSGFSSRLVDFGAFKESLPLLDGGIGNYVNIDAAFAESFALPMQNYLAPTNTNPTVEGVKEVIDRAIANLPHLSGDVTIQIDPLDPRSILSFTIDATYQRTVDVKYDLANAISDNEDLRDLIQIEGDLSAKLNFTLDFNITIGIDRSKPSAVAGAFVSFADNENTLSASIDLTTASPIKASVGFLGVELDNPTASLNLSVAFDTIQQSVNLSELSAADLSTIASVTPSTAVGANEFDLHLPITTDLAGLGSITSSIDFDEIDIFGAAAAPKVNTEELAAFRTISTDGFFNALQQLQNTFGAINSFDAEIPLTGGKRLSDVVSIAEAFGAEIIGASANSGANNELIAAFKNAQEFADKVASRTTYVAATSTSPAELLFDVSFDHVFNIATFPMDFGTGIGELSIQSDSTLKVDAGLAAALEIGIKLEQPGAGFGFGNLTYLSDLNGGKGIPTEAARTDLRITLSNGKTKDLDLSSVTTIEQLITALKSGADFTNDLVVEFDTQRNLISGSTYNQGLILIDKSTSVNGGKLKFEMLNGSLAGPTLGLFGTGVNGIKLGSDNRPDETTHGLRTGPLHGQSLANQVFVRRKAGVPMFSATASLSSDIDGAAHLGFVEIAIADGTALGLLRAEFTPSYPSTTATDSRIDGAGIIDLASSAKLRLQAQRPVKFGEAYSGNLLIEVTKEDGTKSEATLGFNIPANSTSEEIVPLVLALNAQLVLQGASKPEVNAVRVVSSGGKLNFFLADGIGRFVTVKPATSVHAAAVSKLGIKEDLIGYVASPKISASAHFDLPFTVNLKLGSITLSPLARVLSFSVPDLTLSDLSLPENFNPDALGLGSVDDYLQRLKSLNSDTIIQALRDGLDLLRKSVAESALFNQQLPMLNINLREVLDFTDNFAEIIANMNGSTASGIGQLDEVFEDLFGVAESNGGGPDYPNFAVSIIPQLNQGLEFPAGVKLDSIEAFPNEVVFRGETYTNLITYLGALQADNPAFGLSLDETGDDLALRIDLPFDIGRTFGVRNQVQPLGFEVPINVDLSDLGESALSQLIDARGSAIVGAHALGQVTLSVGIDLPENGRPRPFLYDGVNDGTSLAVLVRAAGADINFDVSLGPIGASLTGGGFNFGGATTADPLGNSYASFSVGIADNNADGRHYFSEIVETVQNGLDISDFTFAGSLNASLIGQLSFPGLPLAPYTFDASIGGTNLTELASSIDVQIYQGTPATPFSFTAVKQSLSENFNILALVGGWDGAFDLLIDAMEGQVFGVELPFIGDKLKDQANFLRDIKDSVSANFADNAENQANGTFTNLYEDVRQDLLDAIGPNGIDLLKDLTGDNQVTIDDIVIEQLNPGIGFQILLGNDLGQLDLPIDFDLGIPGLNLDIDANVSGTLGFELGLSFGVSLDHGFFIDTIDSFLNVFVDVGVPSLSASGELGFLRLDAALWKDEQGNLAKPVALIGEGQSIHSQFTITSKTGGSTSNFDVRIVQKTAQDTNDFTYDVNRRALTLKVTGATTAQNVVTLINSNPTLSRLFTATLATDGNGSGLVADGQRAVGVANSFAGRFTVDILDPGQNDGLLTFSEILAIKSYKDVLRIDATANAALDLHLLASFGGSSSFPSLQSDLFIDWDYNLGDDVQLPIVEFTDIELDLGQFFSGFAGTVLDEVNNILEPVRPIIKFLSQPMPVVSDLAGGSITMLDLLKLQGGSIAKAAAFIQSVADFDKILQSIPDFGSGKLLNMGGAIFDPVTRTFSATGTAADVANAVRALAPADPAKNFNPNDFLKSAETLESEPDDKIKLGFPILDPSNLMGLLSGNVVNLFTLEFPTLELNDSIKKFFPLPIFPIVGVELAGAVGARIDFAFGFDTFGIQQFQQTSDFEDVFNGFYVSDRENPDGTGADKDEVVLTASITAAAALNAGFIKASVGGGLFANINFNLHDNDEDGKVRLVELLDNTLLGAQDGFGPVHIFDIDGKFDAGLFAAITVGIGPFSYTKDFDLARVTLFEFTFPRPVGEGVPLAELQGSTLVLNIGDRAHYRDPSGVLAALGSDIGQDQAEDYRIFAGTEPGMVIVESFGRRQIYRGVARIIGDAGLGDDKIVVSKDITIPVELSGGPGNDTLVGGSGDDILRGGDGDDNLRGGLGNDILEGGAGRDYLMGEAGDDVLRGGDGDDQLFGGDGHDFIYGDDGNDVIHAGSGNDVVYAGAGFDTIYGDGGDDEIHGGADGDLIYGGDGSDTIYGDEGDDRIFGDDGNDIIYGGIGNDVIRGGNGNDTLYGDVGNDQLFGENGRDILYGGAGDDVLQGGLASDELYGGLGNDRLYANTSDPTEVDEARHVLVGGAGDDLIYASPLAFDNVIYGDGVNDEFGTTDSTLDGNDRIFGGAGIDVIYGGDGDDVIYSYGGNDFIDAESGDDTVYAGDENDFVIGGFGDDQLYGQIGDDVLWGGFATLTDLTKFDRSTAAHIAANFVLPLFYEQTEAAYPTGYLPLMKVTPAFVAGLSIAGIEGDGRDSLDGGSGDDMLFGGADSDVIYGGAGDDYIDAGAGNDINVDGGDGNDVIRGGGGNDVLHGGAGIDHILGDGGDDYLFGDAGNGSDQRGQRLFGGDGSDTLNAYAPTNGASEYELFGDQLFGGADGDTLNGNVRREILVGGAGDDLLRGDYLAGPNYAINPRADQDGGGDFLYGEGGEDKLFGGGGDDIMWGGADTDYLDGQKGNDTMYGGGGNDLFVVSAMNSLQSGIDTIDGHFGNFPGDTAADDDATDVLIINGSQNDDMIGLSQTIAGVGQHPQLRIDYKVDYESAGAENRTIFVNVRNSAGKLLVEQFQVAGLAGNDIIGFAGVHPTLLPLKANTVGFDVTQIAARGDWTSTLEGNSGNDIIIGSKGRDRAAGGPGSDTIYGFAGDDRLIGDNGDGFTTDVDRLYAGQGNDDLTGGQGTNYLYSWSLDPGAVGDDFGIFVDGSGNLVSESAGGILEQENTGLNRMLGNEGIDYLYGGTLLDFMYGRGGANTLYRSNGTTFESLGDTIPGDEWKEYAKETGQVWYVSGTNANDEISVNFVTEPGLLSDHHLITRLTDNNGNVTFDAQVRLDFAATDADGNAIWTPNDLLADYAALRSLSGNETLTDLDKLEIKRLETNLVNKLLPTEGDFQAIIIDALAGNDKIIVGPTVQKSVWIDAGDGDDVVLIRGGNAILADKAEIGKTGGLISRNDTASFAYPFGIPAGGVQFNALTFDYAGDIDWFKFTLPTTAGTLNVRTASPIDDLHVQIFAADGQTQLASATGLQFAALNLETSGLEAGTEYLLRLQTNKTPTIYGIEFDFGSAGPIPVVDLGVRRDAVRRDIILGGRGDDILMGGPGEDWILGGDGNDVISGGLDRGAPDLLIGGVGDDTLQIIPDRLPLLGNQPNTVFDPATRTFLPTMNDEIDGGSGTDRILYLGGNLDRRGFEVPDFAAIRYNTGLHRYEFTSLVWDIGQQKFLRDYVDTNGNGRQDADEPDLATYQRQYLFYQARNIENTKIELQAGDDTFHADPSYVFPGTLEEWGIKLGNYQQGATEAALTISGGPGRDHLYGGVLDDKISGGPGDDIIYGSLGNDELFGDGGNDQIFGLKDTSATPLIPRIPRTPDQVIGRPSFGFSEEYRYELVAPFFALPDAGREGIDLNALRPIAHYSFDSIDAIGHDESGRGYTAVPTNITYESTGLRGGSALFTDPSSVFKIGTAGVDLGSAWTVSAWFKGLVDSTDHNTLFRGFMTDHQIIVAGNTSNLGYWGAGGFVDSGYDLVPTAVAGGWHQLTAVGSGGSTKYYLDGKHVGTSNQQGENNVYAIGNNRSGPQKFADQLDEVYLYNKALTAAQVAEHYTTTQLIEPSFEHAAFGFEGTGQNERLSTLRTIGDFNGDGYDDFIASSDTTSYILFGPVALDRAERIDLYADIVVENSILGVPASRFGDVDGDGLSDLAFTLLSDDVNTVTIIKGGKQMKVNGQQIPWPRQWSSSFVDTYVNSFGVGSFAKIDLRGSLTFKQVNTYLMEVNGDQFADVVVIAPTTLGASSIEHDFYELGHIFSGAVVSSFIPLADRPSLTPLDQYANIRSDSKDTTFYTTTSNDINGAGVDDLLFGLRSPTINAASSYIQTNDNQFASAIHSLGTATESSYPLSLVLNGKAATISVEFDKNPANNSLDKIVAQINSKLATTPLGGFVYADGFFGDRLRFGVSQGGVQTLVVTGNGGPLGFGKASSSTGFLYNTSSSLRIPQQGTQGTVTSSQGAYVTVPGLIESVDVFLNITHTYVGDLTATLIAPDGTRAKLVSRSGGAGDNFANTTFSDSALISINSAAAPFSGSYKPLESLSVFAGKSYYGLWSLEITDSADGDVGVLNDWRVTFQYANAPNASGIARITQAIPRQVIAPYLPNLPVSVSDPDALTITVTKNSLFPNSYRPFALGDLNNDGYADFGLLDTTNNQVSVYYGSASLTAQQVAFNINNVSTLTTGDFDHDGEMDLAHIEIGTQNVYIYYAAAKNAANNDGNLYRHKSDVSIPFIDPIDSNVASGNPIVTLSSFDLNGDRFDDLIINSAQATSTTGISGAGRIYAVYGAPRSLELPTSAIIDLENFSVPGSGSFVVNPETGRPEVFTNAGNPFSLASATDEKWFRFTTLGDGKAGDAIRLVDVLPAQLRIPEVPINNPRASAQNLDLANWTKRLDLDIEQSTAIPHVSIEGTGDGTFDYYSFTSTAGSKGLFDIDYNFDASGNAFDTQLFLFDSAGNVLASSDDDRGPGDAATNLASYIDFTFATTGTYTIGVAKYLSHSLGSEISGTVPATGDRYVLHVSIQNHVSVNSTPNADLIDADGGIVAANQSAFDLRNVPAGTYYVRVHDSIGQFAFEFDAPSRGQFAGSSTLPDRDFINGGDGDDLVVGNNDIDRILSGSGADTIVGELTEQRDFSPGDVILSAYSLELISADQRSNVDPVIKFNNSALERAVASSLGRPTTTDVKGIPQTYGPLHASDLNSISSLNASGFGIRTLDGLQNLTNLQSLDLSGNRIASQDSAPFDGEYTIITGGRDLTLLFSESVTISGLAIYNGYSSQFDGTYTLKNAAGTVLGSWTIGGTTDGSNAGVDSFWIVFNSPITTNGLVINATSGDPGSVSYREIEVFQNGPVGLPNIGPNAGRLTIDADIFYLAAHQTETDGDLSSNPDVTSGRGGTLLTYTPSGATPGAGYGVNWLNNGDITKAEFSKLSSLTRLRSLDLSGNAQVTDIQSLRSMTQLQDLYLHGTGLGSVSSTPISEIEGPPQSIDYAPWSLGANAAIPTATTIPHITIQGTTSSAFDIDFFTFTGTAGARVIVKAPARAYVVNLQINDAANQYIGGTTTSTGELVLDMVLPANGVYSVIIVAYEAPVNSPYTLHVSVEYHNYILFAPSDEISKLKNLRRLTLPIPGLFPAAQNLTSQEGQPITITTATAGAWKVFSPAGVSIADGTGTRITFTPAGSGKFTITHAATGGFPFFSQNIAPIITVTQPQIDLYEGAIRTSDQLLTVAGLTVTDAGSATTKQVYVTDGAGVTTDLTTGSLTMNNDIVRLDKEIAHGVTELTVAFWFKTSSTSDQTVFSSKGAIGDDFLAISLQSGNILAISGNNSTGFATPTSFANNLWHHVVVVRNATNDTVTVFFNGVQLGFTNLAGLQPPRVVDGGLVLGQLQTTVGYQAGSDMKGSLDDVAVWRRSLTDAQVAQIFADGIVGNEADLAAYYPLNELGGDIAYDRSSNARNGVIASVDTNTSIVWSTASALAARSFQPLNEGSVTMTVIAHDTQGASDRAEIAINVSNLAPVAVIRQQTAGTSLAGQSVKFDALLSTDPGANDQLTYFWEVTFSGQPAGFVSSESGFEFIPKFAGSYVVRLKVTDPVGATTTATTTIAVNPSIAVVANQTGNEGSVFVFGTDNVSPVAPNASRTYRWRVLADGNAIITENESTTASTFAFAAPDNGTYSVELRVTDSPAFSTTQIVSTVVTSNVAPTIAFGATTFGTEGSQVTLAPAIFDAGSADTLTYLWAVTTVRNGNTVTVLPDSASNLATLRFTPTDDGTYTATLIVTDDDGAATLSMSTTIIVANSAPVVEPASDRLFGGNLEFDEGTNRNRTTLFFYFSEAGPLDFNSPFTYQVDYGDGTQEQGTRNRYSQNFWVASHTYAESGVYIVNFTLIDKDGAAGTATRRVTINNLAPQNVTVSGPATADEDTTVTFTGTAADIHNFIPGSPDNEPLRALVDFGDGTVLPTRLRPRLNLVAEVEPNNTYATGQNLETLTWSNAYNPATQYGQGPHVSVLGTGNGTDDWYRFVVEQSEYAEISVRDANFAAVLSLVNVATGTLTTGDIWNVQPDWIQFGSNETAEYAILVQRSNGAGGTTPLQPGDEYIIDFVVYGHDFVTLPFEERRDYDFTARHVYATPGTYNVTVTVQDDDGGRTTSPMSTIVIADNTAPSVSALAVTPNPRNTVVGEVGITFSKPISGFGLNDLTLTRGGANLLSGSAATLTNLGGGNWRLGNLSGLTAIDGSYALQLSRTGSGIVDSRGLELSNNLQLLWTADFTPPTISVDSLTTISNQPRLTGEVNDPSATIEVTVAGRTYLAENLRDGTWRLQADMIDPLPVGPYEVVASATDLARNVGSDTSTNELVIVEPPVSNSLGNHVVIELPAGLARNIVVRRVVDNLQVINLAGPTILSNTQLAATSSLKIIGSPVDADTIWIDFATGGSFRLPGGIEVIGGNGLNDALTVTGSGNTQAVYSMLVSPVGQTQLTVFDSAGSTTIRYGDYESLTFDGLLSFAANSVLNVGSTSLTINSQTPVDLSGLTLLSGGSIHSSSALVLGASESLIGYGLIDAPLAGEIGSSIQAQGDLWIGKATSPIGFATRGELHTGPHTVTLLDSNQAVLGSLTQLGRAGEAAGTLLAANGLLLDFGHNLQGWGTLQSPNDPFKLLMNNGSIAGNNLVEVIELTGYVKGVGSLDNVEISGTYSPGFSPAVLYNGSVTYSATGRTVIEIGGSTPGESGHDQLNHQGSVVLGGILELQLIGAFEPTAGQSFVVFTANDGLVGSFASVLLPDAPTGSGWDLQVLSNEIRLTLVDLAEVGAVIVGSDPLARQRSSVTELNVQFDGLVDIDAGAFEIQRRGTGGGPVANSFTTRVDVHGNTVATIIFDSMTSGSLDFTRGLTNALIDGNYQLMVLADRVRRAGTSVRLDGNRNGEQGGDYVFGAAAVDQFFAFYGDTRGIRAVGAADFNAFRQTFGKRAGQAGWNAALDFDGNNAIGALEFNEFRKNFGKTLGWE